MVKNKILALGLIGGWLISIVFAGGCVPQETPEGGFDWMIILFLILMFAIVYFLMIRPHRRRQKEHEELMAELRKGDRVITAGGIYGQIESISEDSVILKVESGATMRVARGSIVTKRSR